MHTESYDYQFWIALTDNVSIGIPTTIAVAGTMSASTKQTGSNKMIRDAEHGILRVGMFVRPMPSDVSEGYRQSRKMGAILVSFFRRGTS